MFCFLEREDNVLLKLTTTLLTLKTAAMLLGQHLCLMWKALMSHLCPKPPLPVLLSPNLQLCTIPALPLLQPCWSLSIPKHSCLLP